VSEPLGCGRRRIGVPDLLIVQGCRHERAQRDARAVQVDAGHLRGVAQAYQLLLQLESAPGSMAQQESLGQKYAGFGASRPELEAGLLPLMLLGHTCDHAHALAAALEAPGAIISPLSLVRPSLESAAQAFYVLEAPAVPERVRRWLNFRLQAAVEQLRMLDENERATVPGAVREQRWIADVMSSARAHGYQPNAVRKQKASLVPERWLNDRPKSQTLIKQLLDEPGRRSVSRRCTSSSA